MTAILRVRDLVVSYQDAIVLDHVSLEVSAGGYVGIVGPNGSGKTTLIRTILGMVEPSGGTIDLFGEPHNRFRRWQRVGYLPQLSRIPTHRFPAKVSEVVATGLLTTKRFPRWLGRQDAERVDAMLETLGIAELKHRLIGRLSGGQRQRVFLARALVSQPDLLILDEPIVALDPTARARFYETVAQLNRERHVTVLMISHDMATMHDFASDLLYLDRRVVFFGGLKSFCESEAMRTYFGEAFQHVICGHIHGK